MIRRVFALCAFVLSVCITTAGGQPALAQTHVPQNRAEIALGFAPLVKQAAPAVVNIYAKIVTQQRSSFAGDPFFEDFFRGLSQPRRRVQNSLGSGVILSDEGIVVSNYHVVGMATDIRVVTSDRREYDARVILADEQSDLALLQLENATDLPYLDLRNSDAVEVGELALAIGNPFGVGQTVSSGIISGLARTGGGGGQGFGYYIQTDAPINPGNSGGALIDVNGDLIGINTRILSRSGGSNGIGFAIPANLVREFLRQAEAKRNVFERPWAGMSGQPVEHDLAEALGLPHVDGMLISELHPASPFSAAGFQPGDVVLEVDGQPVNSPAEMLFRLTVSGLNNDSQITRLRDGTREVVAVALIEAPNIPESEPVTLGNRTPLPQMQVAQINPRMISRMQLPLSAQGVVILEAGPYGRRAGLRVGDIVAGVNGTEIDTPDTLQAQLRKADRRLNLDILRQGKRLRLRFRL